MFAVFMAALNTALAFVFRSVLVKFALYFGLWFVCTEFIAILAPKLPGASSITSAMSGISPGVWWVLDLFRLDFGLPAVLAAAVTRFAIRRLPIIG